MDSRYAVFNVPRRPVASAPSTPIENDPPPPYELLPGRPPLPPRPRLRTSKSTGGLRASPSQQQNPRQRGEYQREYEEMMAQRRDMPPVSRDRPALAPGFVNEGSLSHAASHTTQPQRRAEMPPPSPLSKSKPATTLPPGFTIEDPSSSSHALPLPDHTVRRAKSSNDLFRPQTSSCSSSTQERPPLKTEPSWKKALDEAQYLAAGLFSSPSESTRAHSLIRHSPALVWYRGPTTSATLSVLSAEPLPPTRSLWLQRRGFSGGAGMALKALAGAARGGWLDVTPAVRAAAADLSPKEERGVQRDVRRFVKKATGRVARHVWRETYVVRIPAAAEDGYFRVVLCGDGEGKKVLCGSPVLRIASTAVDGSVVRGAGVRTLPLEMGVKIASTIGATMAATYAGAATGAVKAGAGKVVTSKVLKKVGTRAYQSYEMSGVGDKVKDGMDGARRTRRARYDAAVAAAMMEPTVGVVGSEDGPGEGFPVGVVQGRVVRGSGYTMGRRGFPTANVAGVRDQVLSLKGLFAAWAMVTGEGDGHGEWFEAVVRIGPPENAKPSVVMPTQLAVHILHDFEAPFYDASVKILLMAFLRPVPTTQDGAEGEAETEREMQSVADDILTTMATLGRGAWGADEALARLRTERGRDGWGGMLGDAVERAEQVPVHWAGVRSEAGMRRDGMVGRGGMWVRRDG